MVEETVEKSRAWPKADNKLSKDLMELLNQATHFKQVWISFLIFSLWWPIGHHIPVALSNIINFWWYYWWHTNLVSYDIVEEGSQRNNKSSQPWYGRPRHSRRWHWTTRNYPPLATPLWRQSKLSLLTDALYFRTYHTCMLASKLTWAVLVVWAETSLHAPSYVILSQVSTPKLRRWRTR